jgi:hypothetical protein
MRWIVCLLFVALVPVVPAQNRSPYEWSLKGVRGVAVQVAGVSPALARAGLQAGDLQAEIEGVLRKEGVPVVSTARQKRTASSGVLRVVVAGTVSHVDGKGNPVAFAVTAHADFFQEATLNGPRTRGNVITWRTGFVVAAGKDTVRSRVRADVAKTARQFSASYLRANAS